MKEIAVINDLSGFGKCSLTASIPVLSVLGCCCHPVATAVLTGQSGYEHYFCQDLTDMLPEYQKQWEKNRVRLDAIYTGYMTTPAQFDTVSSFIRSFKGKNTFLLVDPVMGDQGKTYSIYSDLLLEKMRNLCRNADMITPNLTEACLLAGVDYRQFSSVSDTEELLTRAEELAKQLKKSYAPSADVIITGILPSQPANSDVYMIAVSDKKVFAKQFPFYDKSYSGTGDLFASIMCGLKMHQIPLEESLELTGTFLSSCIKDTIREGTPGTDGILFEPHLPELYRMADSASHK